MNGAYGRRRYGFSSTRVTVNGLPVEAGGEPAGAVARRGAPPPAPGLTRPVFGSKSLPVAIRSPSSATRVAWKLRGPSALPCDGEAGLDVPVVGGAERHPLPLPLDHDPGGDRLHPAGGEPGHDLLPQHRGDLVAVEPVEDAAGLLGVDQVPVDLARVGDRRLDGRLGDLVEDHPLDRHLGLERLQQVPGDRLALAVLIGGEEDLVDLLGQLDQLVDLLLAVRGDDVERREAVVDVDAEPRPRLLLYLAGTSSALRGRSRTCPKLASTTYPGPR